MKAKKKPLRIKHRVHEEENKKRKQRIALGVSVAVLICVSGFLVNSMLNQPSPSQTVTSTSEPTAAIVDQLSLTFPNQTFIERATTILKQAGYAVDYFPGEEIGVNFYRKLAIYGYRLIILRVHTTKGGALFTSEPYSIYSYVEEQLNDQLWAVSYYGGQPSYFGIPPSFIKSRADGRFAQTVVIAMGCYGLTLENMARAFTEKGAMSYIGWNDSVSASQTDEATTQLLQHLITEGQTIKQAVENTMKEVRAYIAYNNTLEYYPPESSNYAIQR
jgi:hypothetical protein